MPLTGINVVKLCCLITTTCVKTSDFAVKVKQKVFYHCSLAVLIFLSVKYRTLQMIVQMTLDVCHHRHVNDISVENIQVVVGYTALVLG